LMAKRFISKKSMWNISRRTEQDERTEKDVRRIYNIRR